MPPTFTSVAVGPTPTFAGGDLTATPVGAADADGDAISFSFVWQVNGTVVASGVGVDTLSGGTLVRGDDVVVVVSAFDACGTGSTLTSAPVIVQNSPPTSPAIAIVPTPAPDGTDLVCQVITDGTDADGDSVSYVITWDHDGTSFAGSTTTTLSGDTVPATETDPGQLWTCSVLATDGTDSSAPATASADVIEECSSVAPGSSGAVTGTPLPTPASTSGATVEAWVRIDADAGFSQNYILDTRGNVAGNSVGFFLNVDPDQMQFGVHDGFPAVTEVGNYSVGISLGTFHHVAGVAEGTARRLYVDGSLVGTLTVSAAAANAAYGTGPVKIGTNFAGGEPLQGAIDEVRVSSSVWYSGNSFAPPLRFARDADTVALWRFDASGGNPTRDESANGLDLGLTGTAAFVATCAGGIDDLACAIPSGTEAAAPAVSHVAEVLDGGSRSYLVAPAGVAGCLGTSYTVDGWFLWKGHTAADDANPAIFNPILFSYFQVNGDQPDVVFQIHKGDHLLDVVVDYGGVATRTEFFGVTPISAGVWHHAALIVDNGAVSIFLDGSFEGSSTLNDPMFDMPPGEWWFGMRQDLRRRPVQRSARRPPN